MQECSATAVDLYAGAARAPVLQPIERILTVRDVMRATSYSRTSIYRLVAAGEFPDPIKLGKARVGWRASTVARWLADRPSAGLSRAA